MTSALVEGTFFPTCPLSFFHLISYHVTGGLPLFPESLAIVSVVFHIALFSFPPIIIKTYLSGFYYQKILACSLLSL